MNLASTAGFHLGAVWLITSTSSTTNKKEESLATVIVEHLRRQVEEGERRVQPTSALEMGKVIIDYCIGTYERKYKLDKVDEGRDQHMERSVRQIFSDSINEIVRGLIPASSQLTYRLESD